MIIGVLKENRVDEFRVSLQPVGVELLARQGHRLLVEAGAGEASGHADADYADAGAERVARAEAIYERADLVLKVKEPQPQEYGWLREGQVLFTFFHFAASETLTRAVIDSRCVAIAYETIESSPGHRPLLTPMSEVAGRMAVQQAAKYLEREHGGLGVLLGGVPGVKPATVVVLGGGVVGSNAARIAAGMGARVHILDIDLERLRHLSEVMPANVITEMSNAHNLRRLLRHAHVVISGVLIPGARAPKLLTRELLKTMKPGAVVVDVAIDQGGSLETSRPTTHEDPIFVEEGVVHYCVTNMPGAIPATSTIALTNATLPYVMALAENGFQRAILKNRAIRKGANIVLGHVTHPGVADAFSLPWTPAEEVIRRGDG